MDKFIGHVLIIFPMEQQYKHIGRLMKAARRFKKENQESVSKAIGCSQSALSKLEHGTLIPSAPQWFDLCRYLHIPLTSLETGVLDRHRPIANVDEVSFIKWPKRYRLYRSVKSRELYPFVSYLRQLHGDEAIEKMFDELGLDIDLAVDFDHQMNHLVLFDVIHYFIKNEICGLTNIKEVADRYASPICHGEFVKSYSKANKLKELLQLYIDDQSYYQLDLKFEFESTSETSGILVIKKEKHFDLFLKDLSSDVIDFYAIYLKSKMESFLTSFLKTPVLVNPFSSQTPQGFPERFEIKIKN